jgi:glycogen debranching enzyme
MKTNALLSILLLLAALGATCGVAAWAQTASMASLPDFLESAVVGRSDNSGLSISREVVAGKPFSVVGPHGALLGYQSGDFEAWIFPWKIFSGMRISAAMENYPAIIDVNKHAAAIEVTPDHTTITYAHANFTVKQIMIAPKAGQVNEVPGGAAVMVFYQIEAAHPMTLTFNVDAMLQRMWPAESDAHPSCDWIPIQGRSGFYALRNFLAEHAAAIAMPGAEAGMFDTSPENGASLPLQFVLHYDPKNDAGRIFPLLVIAADQTVNTTNNALAARLAELDRNAQSLYRTNERYYQDFISQHTSIETPDEKLNAAFSWAEVAIDQLRVPTLDGKQSALTAGFLASGDSVRPGFGWFFGRDALWSLYALHSYGDFATARSEIEFLISLQRNDGKIIHEWSQTADLVDWKSMPYEYAAADSTPLFLMAVNDYLKISGDADFVHKHWSALALAWQFETSHVSNDGIYNNQQGTGWVESWVPAMPYQEIYLAALDEQASLAFSDLADAAGHPDLGRNAAERAHKVSDAIQKEYFSPSTEFYVFSRNADGSTDDSATIFPSVAWWDGTFGLDRAEKMLSRWASSEFSTDWGTRDLSDRVSFYDPVSYHQGSVWPLFTGWVSMAEYRAGRALSAYAHLMQNANLTWSQDLGSVTELLSGQFYQAPGRSTAHQLWSSAMVITPVLRGMFGIEWKANQQTLSVTPQLPAQWTMATIHRIPLGASTVDLTFTREGRELIVHASGATAGKLHLQSRVPGARVNGGTLRIPMPAAEIEVKQELPEFGSDTRQMKILDERYTAHGVAITLAAQGGSREILQLRENASNLKVSTQDAELGPAKDGMRAFTVLFPPGQGYVTKTVTLSW